MTDQTTTTGDQATITGLEQRRWDAQIAADLEALDELYGDGLRYTHSNGLVDTKASYLKAIADGTFDYRSEDRTDVEITVVDDTAVVTGRARFLVIVGGSREADLDSRYCTVWIRSGGSWRCWCYQSTPVG
ncbi:MAG: nuclear transport factor 2 family protein [Acidimicrobiales bacterium]